MADEAQHKRKLGLKGEKLARRYLKKQGYRYLAHNYATRRGEIDLIMQDEQTIVFVEVKTREDESFARGEDSVNYGKQKRIFGAARHFIHVHDLYEKPCRFDLVVVTGINDQAVIRHHKNAFSSIYQH